MSREAAPRRLDAGDHRLHAGVEQVLDHHHRVVALLQRLGVEEGGQARQRLGVVVHGDGDVLLVGAELVGDLVVEAFDEGGGRHGRGRYRLVARKAA